MVELHRELTVQHEEVVTIQLEERYLEELVRIVGQYVDTDVWQPVIFGSRASGRAQRFSDIDLGFIGSKELPGNVQAKLWAALDDSDIPYVVDIVDMSASSQDFLAVAREHMEYLRIA
ncbi:MAG: nucleotidyltransferase domain-containing protein [Actinobacteria bacterium]|nr:nucleotidyltransferase domain-containing protein [Actinomycetota bacterium]MCL5447310.1 nucleotidyltransferase domain-containing protein [Actinomycetota bacterium]